MNSRPGARGRSKIARHVVAVGLTLSMGYALGLSTLGGCAGAPWPSHGNLPERVVDKLTECGKKGPTPLQSENYDLAFIVHVTEGGAEARVDDVTLKNSTLHFPEVEACMTDALYGMRAPLEALALRRRNLAPDPTVAPEARVLLGQAQVVQLLEAMAFIVVGYAAYTVVVTFLRDKHHTKQRPPPPRSQVEEPPKPEPPKPAPRTEADPKTTDPPPPPPPPPPRRYPKQTCENDELDALEAEKKKLCYSGYAATCGDPTKKRFTKIPCSAIKLSIQQRLACLKARKLIQEKCFGGKPDAGHKQQIDDTQNGIDNCEALKLVNCANGHPMAGR